MHGKYSFVSVSIIAWLAYDTHGWGENTTQNLGCKKVIPRCNIIIGTANKITNKQGKSAMLDFFTNRNDLCQLTVATSRRPIYIFYKYFFASFNNNRWINLDDKTKDYVDRNAGGQVESLHEVTQLGQYSRWKFAYLSGRTKKIISRKLKYIFTKKLHHNY